MEQGRSPQFSLPFSLEPIDLYNQDEIDELIRQRKGCGWEYDMQHIDIWRDQTKRGKKRLFWIVVQTPEETNNSTSITPTQSTKAGHISLSSETSIPDPDLCSPDGSVQTINTFYIYPSYRRTGLGRAAWSALEDKARQLPECKQIAVETWDRRYSFDDSPEWAGMLRKNNYEIKRGFVNEDWFVRMGYVKFKGMPRYPIEGTDDLIVASFLRKQLK